MARLRRTGAALLPTSRLRPGTRRARPRPSTVTYRHGGALLTIELRDVRTIPAWQARQRGLRWERCIVGVNEHGAEVALLERRVLAVA